MTTRPKTVKFELVSSIKFYVKKYNYLQHRYEENYSIDKIKTNIKNKLTNIKNKFNISQ